MLQRLKVRRKRRAELEFWQARAAAEGELANYWYERAFTTLFGVDAAFFAGKRMLDVGCGPRGSLEWATSAARRVGLDPLAAEYAALSGRAARMEYAAGRAERIPFADHSFDVVSVFNALDHVERLDRAVAEIKRVTAPGGSVLLLVEVGRPPTVTEPIELDWDVLDRFGPEFGIAHSRRYEQTDPAMYLDLLERAVPYDDARTERRPAWLAAHLTRP